MAGDARLFVLATLDRLGEAHGHEVAREAALDRTDNWAHVSEGALYSALRRAEAEDLVEAIRTEQVGRFPARTVYRITGRGRDALHRGRDDAWHRIGLPPDPFDLALSISDGLQDTGALRDAIRSRLDGYTAALSALRAERERLRPRLEPTALAVFEHVMLRHETEIEWHRRLLARVDGFTTARAHTEP